MNIESKSDQLQRRLDGLENTGSFEAGWSSTDPEERELLELADQLRQVQAGPPDPTAVAAQRAMVVARTNGLAAAPSWLARMRDRLNFTPQQLWVGGAAAVFLLLIGIVLAQPSANENGQMAEGPESDPAGVVADEAADEPHPAIVENGDEGAAGIIAESQPEGSPADGSGTTPAESLPLTIYLPLNTVSLVSQADKAAVHNIRGRVERRSGDGSWEVISRGSSLSSGDQLRTGILSGAQVRFYDGSEATLDANSEIAFDVIDAQRPDSGFRTVVMRQTAGRSWHDVDHRGDSGSRYEVKTHTASGVARGTRFVVTVGQSGGQKSQYEVTEGRVDVSGAGRTVAVVAGQRSAVAPDGPPTVPVFSIDGRGTITAIADNQWTIAGQIFVVTAETIIVGEPKIGDTVAVSGHLATNGQRIADRLEKIGRQIGSPTNQFTLVGEVETQSDDSWMVQGQTIVISDTTAIEDDIEVGNTVQVNGVVSDEGALIALEIVLVEEAAGFPFTFAGLVDSVDPWRVAGVDLVVDEDTDIEDGIVVGDAVVVSGLIDRDGRWIAADIAALDESQGTFSLSGSLDGINPWSVAGLPFEVDGNTRLAAGLAVGDLVFVRGRILADGTWLAESVERLEAGLLEIVFAGVVDGIDPWIVNGLPLTLIEGSLIEEGIEVGDLVRVTARIEGDGRWTIVEIVLLSREEIGSECVTLTAVVTSVSSGQIILSDGTTASLDDLEIEGELQVGSVVVIVACIDDDGMIIIEQIIVLWNPPPVAPPTAPPSSGGGQSSGGFVTICHKPGTPAEKTKTLPSSALNGHLGHGDTMGACP